MLIGNLDREVRGHGVGELGIVLDLLNDANHFGRHLLVELHIVLELVDDRARKRFSLHLLAGGVREHHCRGFIVFHPISIALDLRARGAFDQYFDGAVRQLEQLQHAGERSNLENGARRRIVVGGILLRGEQDEGVRAHHLFQRLDRLFAPDEKRNDHVGKDDDIAQR